MNKKLFEKVKAKCKDTGLSEKYLRTITEKMGGSIEDDSTDEAAMEEVVNQIADIAVETQGEATRWANKKPKEEKNSKDSKSTKKEEKEGEEDDSKKDEDPNAERIAAMEKELAEFKAAQSKTERNNLVKAAQAKHKIPEWRMKGLAVPADQDPDEYLAAIKQDLITNNLMSADPEGSKAANEKAIEATADSLLESITVK